MNKQPSKTQKAPQYYCPFCGERLWRSPSYRHNLRYEKLLCGKHGRVSLLLQRHLDPLLDAC
ncbi:MAG: hypothetical protein HC890_02640 [Chloroflexaceae bacterium]|nr:hypothetical protein [Chloroflexaceae bacterium]